MKNLSGNKAEQAQLKIYSIEYFKVQTFKGSTLAEIQLEGLKSAYGRNLTADELKSTFIY